MDAVSPASTAASGSCKSSVAKDSLDSLRGGHKSIPTSAICANQIGIVLRCFIEKKIHCNYELPELLDLE